MPLPDEQFFEDERDWQAQQQVDNELQEMRLTDILRRVYEGVPVSKEDALELCVGCGIDKRLIT